MVGIIDKIKETVKEGEEELVGSLKKGEKSLEKAVKKVVEEVEESLGMKPKSGEEKNNKTTKSKSKSKESKSSKENLSSEKFDEKSAEAESTVEEKSLEDKKKELLERAKKLKEKISAGDVTSEDLKEKVKVKKKEMLIPLEEYVKAGIYLGTRVVTPNMRPFVYRRRADGLAIFNTDLIDEKIREGIEYLSKFSPEETILVCKRQAGWRAAKKFSEITGIRVFTKKYPAGILTNKQLPDFFENELTIITDHWIDKNALNDTLKVRKNVLMICDTNNFSKGANQFIIGNNKSPKSLGIIFYLLSKEYCKARGINAEIPDLEWWVGEVEDAKEQKPKQKPKKVLAEAGVQIED